MDEAGRVVVVVDFSGRSREIIAAIDSLDFPEANRRKIYEKNIRRLARQRLRG